MVNKLKHKYNAVKKITDGIAFPSKKEEKFYTDLKIKQQKGEVILFIRQPSFDLSAGVKYKADFLIFYADGNCEFVDVKGYKTSNYIIKKKMVEEKYNIQIIEV